MRLLKSKLFLCVGVLLLLTACDRSHESAEHHSADPDSAAGKAGQAAYKVSKETEKAAKELGHKVAEAAKDAKAGFKDAKQEDKTKHDQ
jgi:hypothetical protein